jgi:hypothetical protein
MVPPFQWRAYGKISRARFFRRRTYELRYGEGVHTGGAKAHGRFSGIGRPVAWIAADIVRIENGRLAEHWDVLQDEATKAESKSGLPMFGNRFTA